MTNTQVASLLLAMSTGIVPLAGQAEFSTAQIEFFESKVRPVLARHCFECHSGRSKTLQAGLRLDSRQSLLDGGDSGPAARPGNPDKSLLIQALRWESLEMPPLGKLPDEQIAVLGEWVEMGLPWPDEQTHTGGEKRSYDWVRLREQHWAFRAIQAPSLPRTLNMTWPKNEIDVFVLSRLEQVGMQPAPPADARTLIRRLYLDLIGLPPDAEQVEAFRMAVQENRDEAIRRVVDDLLESAHYGERWGRHWLDVARYSDGHGGFLDNNALPDAWRYRDWVVQALNHDLPFNEFVRLQIAGDLLEPPAGATPTGFFALGPTYRSDGGDPDSVAQARGETLDDRVDTLSRGLLALTVSCARCHDHKFDPIPQQDYYSLAGVFNNTRTEQLPLAPAEDVKAFQDQQANVKNLENEVKQTENKIKIQKREATDEEKKQLELWNEKLIQLKQQMPAKPASVHALADSGSGDMRIAIRGDLRKPGEVAPRRFLQILAGKHVAPFQQGSGRVGLAEAIVDPANPLTARVFVNRVWMHHFGRAIVRTPSNFGALGEQPTHPQLLDWMADRFIRGGWSLKKLHRTILLSATYQMSSRFDEASFAKDGDNRLIWRMNPRRIDAEAWRDSLLAVTGELDRSLGGPPSDSMASRRRTLYFKVSRNGDQFASDAFLQLFDFPLMRATVAKRPTSIVPQQFLFMMNSTFMEQRARALAARLEREAVGDVQRIQRAYRLLYGRPPSPMELKLGRQFLGEIGGLTDVAVDSQNTSPSNGKIVATQTPAINNSSVARWQQYAQVLLSSNEFMYVR